MAVLAVSMRPVRRSIWSTCALRSAARSIAAAAACASGMILPSSMQQWRPTDPPRVLLLGGLHAWFEQVGGCQL